MFEAFNYICDGQMSFADLEEGDNLGRWDSDDEYVERITELFADLKEEQKTWLCKVAEQMMIDNRKEQK